MLPQLPQSSPHPSSPHSLPLQLGMQQPGTTHSSQLAPVRSGLMHSSQFAPVKPAAQVVQSSPVKWGRHWLQSGGRKLPVAQAQSLSQLHQRPKHEEPESLSRPALFHPWTWMPVQKKSKNWRDSPGSHSP